MLKYLWMILRGYRLVIQPRIKLGKRKLDFDEPAWVKTTKRGVHIVAWDNE